jgi:hypothetical protein
MTMICEFCKQETALVPEAHKDYCMPQQTWFRVTLSYSDPQTIREDMRGVISALQVKKEPLTFVRETEHNYIFHDERGNRVMEGKERPVGNVNHPVYRLTGNESNMFGVVICPEGQIDRYVREMFDRMSSHLTGVIAKMQHHGIQLTNAYIKLMEGETE